jgi:hypothetical protein
MVLEPSLEDECLLPEIVNADFVNDDAGIDAYEARMVSRHRIDPQVLCPNPCRPVFEWHPVDCVDFLSEQFDLASCT